MNENNEKIKEFIEWAIGNGVHVDVSKVEVIHAGEGKGFGIFTKEEISNDQEILSIPLDLLISDANILRYDEHLQKLHESENLNDERLLIIIFLVWYRFGPDNAQTSTKINWKTYTSILPNKYTSASWWSQDELESLQGTPLHSAALAKKKRLEGEYEQLSPKVSQYYGEASHEVFTFEHFQWADSTYWSRVLEIPVSLSEDAQMSKCLIPFLDFCNHSSKPNATWSLESSKNFPEKLNVALRSTQKIEKGQELLISYGDKGNEELLFQYGFALPNNPFDTCMLMLPIMQDDPLVEVKIQILQSVNLRPRIFVKEGGILDDEAFTVARIVVLDESDMENSDIIHDFVRAKRKSLIKLSELNELRVYSLLKWVLSEKLEEMTERESKTEESITSQAEIYRHGQLKLIQLALENINKRESEFMSQPHIQELVAALEEQSLQDE